MLTLRFTKNSEGADTYQVGIMREGGGLPSQTATSRFRFEFTTQDQENLRWYLEDYPQYPFDPAPTIAARIERRMAELGRELFACLFQNSDDAHNLWMGLRKQLANTRIEIITNTLGKDLPWELLRDPETNSPLAVNACAFVHTRPMNTHLPNIQHLQLSETSGHIRILLVICRPRMYGDVPFRPIASRLIRGLGNRDDFQLDVLRPPTLAHLKECLHAAYAEGKPYHIVHFDGHGIYSDPIAQSTGKMPKRPRGYLLFENEAYQGNQELVHGTLLGRALTEAGVPLLVLNACRSDYLEVPVDPGQSPEDDHSRMFGSLAQEVLDAGVKGVVAMRYNIYVVTAAQFVANLYATLAQGSAFSEAATFSRQQLYAQPLRQIGYETLDLQDWLVPVIYEARQIALFPKRVSAENHSIILHPIATTPARQQPLDLYLPSPPDVGFFGQDQTLLTLDRTFDTQHVILLLSFAGSGKTTTAAEFARWYAFTGGVKGPVLFTSFEQYKPLARVLDTIEQVFGKMLEQRGIHWLALNDRERYDVALQVLNQIPVLWVWDSVEAVAGFPPGTASSWSITEQQELADFLRAARDTQAKFLLTSRCYAPAWLDDIPIRFLIPPISMQERLQLAQALAEKQGMQLTKIKDWRLLLQFTQGNPLTIIVLVNQALHDGIKTKEQIEAFVAKLRAGEAAFRDEASEGRLKSLGASLSYGFEHAFNEQERKQLALLHFFQGFMQVDVLCMMGEPKASWCLPTIRGMTRDTGIALLYRAAEIGLLTFQGNGMFFVHPALPWYFRSLFDHYYPASTSSEEEVSGVQATHAFVTIMGELGELWRNEHANGNRNVIDRLVVEEDNLLHARRLACATGQWHELIMIMQGLRTLYDRTNRTADWSRLVDETIPYFVDADTGGPLPGLEEGWRILSEYRIWLAVRTHKLLDAERLARLVVNWSRQNAAPALAKHPRALNHAQRNTIRTLAVSLDYLGMILRGLKSPDCIEPLQEAMELYEQIADQQTMAIGAFNLGQAYKDIPSLHNLAQAKRWIQRSLELLDKRDYLGQARCLNQLGRIAYERFGEEAVRARESEEKIFDYLEDAEQFFIQAIHLLPQSATDELAYAHHSLGDIYRLGSSEINGMLELTLAHYNEAIRYRETIGDFYGAAGVRYNAALALEKADRLADALLYAQAALRNYEPFGSQAEAKIQDARELIGRIENALKASRE